MEGLSISEVAQETGFSPSALRFYESAGLITPARTPAGYRSYDAASIETLLFIARAKRLGLSLDDIGGLVTLFDDPAADPCRTACEHC
jgi:DNA-binding transcriptional MerR regulator